MYRLLVVATLCLLIAPTGTNAAKDRKTYARPTSPEYSYTAPAVSDVLLESTVLSGLDFTAIAPPEVRIRITEDEPYTIVSGRQPQYSYLDGFSAITLHAVNPAGGEYRARISIRTQPQGNREQPLSLSYDTAAHATYANALLDDETRGDALYSIAEVRTNLGLSNYWPELDTDREYLAYSAVVVNPFSYGELAAAAEPSADETNIATADPGAQYHLPGPFLTPYQFIQGQLKTLREHDGRCWLLTVEFESDEFAHALTLTENLARLVINNIAALDGKGQAFTLLAYYPEFEYLLPYFSGEIPHPATADLAERPGEGFGFDPQPVTGTARLPVPAPEMWPAAPYGDSRHIQKLDVAHFVMLHLRLLGSPAALNHKSSRSLYAMLAAMYLHNCTPTAVAEASTPSDSTAQPAEKTRVQFLD